MLYPNQIITTTWNSTTMKYYISKGYKYTKTRDVLYVKIEDLPKGSHSKVLVKCDFCGKDYYKSYKDYWSQCEGGDCCKDCEGIKSAQSVERIYGKGYRGQKIKEFAIRTYGVDNIAKVDEIKKKIAKTNMENIGYTTHLLVPENREKMAIANGNPDVIERRKETNLRLYGYVAPMADPNFRRELAISFYKEGKGPLSKQQKKLWEMLKEIYGSCELNYPCDIYSLDCVVIINGIKINIEYDGRYWHENKQERDEKRNKIVIAHGYKVFRIISSRLLPTKEQIEENINILLNTDKDIIYLELK